MADICMFLHLFFSLEGEQKLVVMHVNACESVLVSIEGLDVWGRGIPL